MKIMRVEESQGIRPGQMVETVYGLAHVRKVYRDGRGITHSLTAEFVQPTVNGDTWFSADLDQAENLKFHEVH